MSDDFIENIWAQFAIETEEHLEAMEQILVAAEGGSGVDADAVARLFRSFHSVKGLAKAMDLLAMERVAHCAEDLLGLVRDGTAALDAATAGLLLEALDELKAMRAKAVAERADAEVPQAVVARLRAAYAAANGEPACVAPAGAPAAAAAPKAVALHEDPEMLRFFMELVQENMLALTAMTNPECAPVRCSGCSGCAEMLTAIGPMAHAAETMGFMRVKDVLEQVRITVTEAAAAPATKRDEVIALLSQFQEAIRYIETESGGDAGARTLAQHLNATMQANFDRLFEDIVKDLDFLDGDAVATGDDEEVAGALFRHLSAANAYLSFLMPESRCDLLLLLEDVFGRAARNELNIFGEIIALAR